MSALREFVGTQVKVLTLDGTIYIGNLEGFDQNTNIVLTHSKERILSPTTPSKEKNLAGLIIRGDDVICIGTFDQKVENLIDYTKIYANEIKDSKNR
jgi:U6 snRNA-associated Sm-like protein LSm8